MNFIKVVTGSYHDIITKANIYIALSIYKSSLGRVLWLLLSVWIY